MNTIPQLISLSNTMGYVLSAVMMLSAEDAKMIRLGIKGQIYFLKC